MLSSMTPTIVERDGELLMVLGTPGGRTIINSVLQVVLNVVDFGMDLDEAVMASRFHHQWLPDRIRVEEDGLDPSVVEALEGMGHRVDARGTQGRVNAILIDPATGERLGFADPRAPDGAAAGH